MWKLNKTIIYTDITYELSNGASKYVAIYFLSLSLSLSLSVCGEAEATDTPQP
jgi:hypothetical protein